MRACVRVRAAALPLATSRSKSVRSASVRFNRYVFMRRHVTDLPLHSANHACQFTSIDKLHRDSYTSIGGVASAWPWCGIGRGQVTESRLPAPGAKDAKAEPAEYARLLLEFFSS